jgi:hypothetical protein
VRLADPRQGRQDVSILRGDGLGVARHVGIRDCCHFGHAGANQARHDDAVSAHDVHLHDLFYSAHLSNQGHKRQAYAASVSMRAVSLRMQDLGGLETRAEAEGRSAASERSHQLMGVSRCA